MTFKEAAAAQRRGELMGKAINVFHAKEEQDVSPPDQLR